jgi:hypothetical protein
MSSTKNVFNIPEELKDIYVGIDVHKNNWATQRIQRDLIDS